MPDYSPQQKVYRAGEHLYSIVDILGSAVSPEYMLHGMPRISEFHLKVGQSIRFRLDEQLQAVPEGTPLTQEVAEQIVFSMLTPAQIAHLNSDSSLDVDSAFSLPNGACQFRLNVFRDRDGIAAVIRLLPPKIPPVEELNFLSDLTWKSIVEAKQGLVLVVGVTGSGKTTTIASFLSRINEFRPVRIITLEDPIEFVFPNKRALFSQREIGRHATSFASGLRSVLRESPDIIFLGEIRDLETATMALTAAETGHLVFTTLHARDCIGALSRLTDMFPIERARELAVQLSFSLSYVISQKLVPRALGTGRCAAFEVLRNNPAISNLMRTSNWQQIYGTMETRFREGMNTLEQSLIHLYQQGLITKDDAIMHANDAAIIDRIDPPLQKGKRR